MRYLPVTYGETGTYESSSIIKFFYVLKILKEYERSVDVENINL